MPVLLADEVFSGENVLLFTPKELQNIAQPAVPEPMLPPMLAATLGTNAANEVNPKGVADGVANNFPQPLQG